MNAQVHFTFNIARPPLFVANHSPAMVSELHPPPISYPIFFLPHGNEPWGYRRCLGPISIIWEREAAEGPLDAMMILASTSFL